MLKNRILLFFIAAICFLASCKNDPPYDPVAQLAIDDGIIAHYLDTMKVKIPALKTKEGLYYQIIDPGTGKAGLGLLDTITVRYHGTFLNGQVFDSTAVTADSLLIKFRLTDAIQGWEIGLPLIQPGGRIRLIIPSTLAYQNRSVGTIINTGGSSTVGGVTTNSPVLPIPPNSILNFDIKLVSVTKPVITTVTTP